MVGERTRQGAISSATPTSADAPIVDVGRCGASSGGAGHGTRVAWAEQKWRNFVAGVVSVGVVAAVTVPGKDLDRRVSPP